jgi:rod shape-determining protein MreC
VRNILLFIRRYFTFISFILLQVIALSFLFSYNKFHEAAFMRVANESTGWINLRYDRLESYLQLKEKNEALTRQNTLLLNQLPANFTATDTSSAVLPDSLFHDSLSSHRKYLWREAKVVSNTVGLPNNYFTIERGENQGIRKDMGVISAMGIAGTVVNTSSNFAVVMSMLHRQFRVSARIKKSGDLGIVQWDGKDPQFVLMSNVPKSVSVAKGDSVVTSPYSYLFPGGLMVGVVQQIINDPASNFYTLKLRTATDFFKFEYAYVVENLSRDEQKKLEDSTFKN